MRPRRRGDWRAERTRRRPLETGVASALDSHPAFTLTGTSTACTDRLDYRLRTGDGDTFELEWKTKRQPYRGWGHLRRDVAAADLFILDELAFRRILDSRCILLVADIPARSRCVWSGLDLALTPETRTVRHLDINPGPGTVKGKLLVDVTADSSRRPHPPRGARRVRRRAHRPRPTLAQHRTLDPTNP